MACNHPNWLVLPFSLELIRLAAWPEFKATNDDPTHGQQQLSFFNGAYGQHMYHPMLIFERHTGSLLSVRLRPGQASSHARIVPLLARLVPRLENIGLAGLPSLPVRNR
jgi:Transposase DDE domain group 1